MPRGRPRRTKVSPMEKAVDAMVPLGFSQERVVKVMKDLLREYGGEDGWHFIESDAYQELIDAILRDIEGNGDGEGHENEDMCQDMSIEDEEVGPSNRSMSDNQQVESRAGNAQADIPSCSEVVSSSSGTHNNEAGETTVPTTVGVKLWENIDPNQPPPHVELQTAKVVPENEVDARKTDPPGHSAAVLGSPSLINIRSPSPSHSLPTGRRRYPCFGWIESDEEDSYDFIRLPSKRESVVAPPPYLSVSSSNPRSSERKRKSRWDERPDEL